MRFDEIDSQVIPKMQRCILRRTDGMVGDFHYIIFPDTIHNDENGNAVVLAYSERGFEWQRFSDTLNLVNTCDFRSFRIFRDFELAYGETIGTDIHLIDDKQSNEYKSFLTWERAKS